MLSFSTSGPSLSARMCEMLKSFLQGEGKIADPQKNETCGRVPFGYEQFDGSFERSSRKLFVAKSNESDFLNWEKNSII